MALRRLILMVVMIGLCCAACRREDASAPVFTDISARAGIRGVFPTYDAVGADFNNDGWLDILVPNHGGPVSLYMNNGDGSFRDKGRRARLGRGDMHGAAAFDFDHDGDRDIYFTMGADRGRGLGKNRLHENLGRFNFRISPAHDVLADPQGRGRSVVVMDYDLNGAADLLVVNFRTPNPLFLNDGSGRFEPCDGKTVLKDLPHTILSPGDYDDDGDLDFFCVGVGEDRLLENRGAGRYVNVTKKAGIRPMPHSQCALWGDYDNDGDLDLYVTRGLSHYDRAAPLADGAAFYCNTESVVKGLDIRAPSGEAAFLLYMNSMAQPDRIFIGRAGRHPEAHRFSLSAGAPPDAAGEPPSDRRPGFYVWRAPAGKTWHLRFYPIPGSQCSFSGVVTTGNRPSAVEPVGFGSSPPPTPDTLYENLGGGGFRDVTSAAGLGNTGSGQGGGWGDFDNDGDLDLYVVNGGYSVFNQPNSLYVNNDDGTFTDISGISGAEADVAGRGFGCLAGDFNNDTFLDLFLTNGGGVPPFHTGPHLLLENRGNRNRGLLITLEGAGPAPNVIGTRVRMAAGGRIQMREKAGGNAYYSFSDLPLHFGLGSRKKPDWLEVRWPDGTLQMFQDVPAAGRIHIKKGARRIEDSSAGL
jgi:hypothetical protein